MKTELYNEDCVKILKNMESESVDLVVTDPPYNASKKKNITNLDKLYGRNAGLRDFGAWDYNFEPKSVIEEISRVTSRDGQIYIFCSTHVIDEWLHLFRSFFDGLRVLTWAKPDPVPSIRQRHWCSANELVLWGWRGKYIFNYMKHKEMYSWQLYQAPKGKNRIHPNQKPLELIKKFVYVSSHRGQRVLDPYMGSGVSGIASSLLGREFIGCETDPKYFTLAKNLIEKTKEESAENRPAEYKQRELMQGEE